MKETVTTTRSVNLRPYAYQQFSSKMHQRLTAKLQPGGSVGGHESSTRRSCSGSPVVLTFSQNESRLTELHANMLIALGAGDDADQT